MTTKEECLAKFSVSAWANTDGAVAQARQAVVDYLECFSSDAKPQLEALRALYADYLELKLDSYAATEIQNDLRDRIGGLTSSVYFSANERAPLGGGA